jgi:hypothetical protein
LLTTGQGWKKAPLAGKPRVHEIAAEMGTTSKIALSTLKNMGEYVKGPSSSIQPPVARRLRAALVAGGYARPVFPSLRGPGAVEVRRLAAALPRSLPTLVDTLLSGYVPGAEFADIFALASTDRSFYFIPERASDAVRRAAPSFGWLDEQNLPSRRGIAAMIEPGAGVQGISLTAWAYQDATLKVATTRFRAAGDDSLETARMRHQTLTRSERGYSADGARWLMLLPTRPGQLRRTGKALPGEQLAASSKTRQMSNPKRPHRPPPAERL